jgi:hypothetical protein
MKARGILVILVVVALLSLTLGALPGWAQERGETGRKAPAVLAILGGLSTEDLTGDQTPEDLVNYLVGEGITVSNVTFSGAPVAAGTFTGDPAILGFGAGIVLSTGDIANIVGPNTADDTGVDNGLPGDPDLDALAGFPTYDAVVLEFDFVPDGDRVAFRYVFASEEYNEYVNSRYNDVFAFYINGVLCSTINGDPVSVNTINNGYPYDTDPRSHPEAYINNDLNDGGGDINTEMDGLTFVLECSAAVESGAVNHIKLAIADASDSVLDSNVFLEKQSFVPVTECCAGVHCPDDPVLSKECDPDSPPFYVVINRTFEDLSRPGSGCQPIILRNPRCVDCCNPDDKFCGAAQDEVESRVCPLLAAQVDWAESAGTEVVYEMCCGFSPTCEGKWYYRVRLLQEDGTCPIAPDSGCFECLPPGTGIKLPAPLLVGGLAGLGGLMLLVGAALRVRYNVRRRSNSAA